MNPLQGLNIPQVLGHDLGPRANHRPQTAKRSTPFNHNPRQKTNNNNVWGFEQNAYRNHSDEAVAENCTTEGRTSIETRVDGMPNVEGREANKESSNIGNLDPSARPYHRPQTARRSTPFNHTPHQKTDHNSGHDGDQESHGNFTDQAPTGGNTASAKNRSSVRTSSDDITDVKVKQEPDEDGFPNTENKEASNASAKILNMEAEWRNMRKNFPDHATEGTAIPGTQNKSFGLKVPNYVLPGTGTPGGGEGYAFGHSPYMNGTAGQQQQLSSLINRPLGNDLMGKRGIGDSGDSEPSGKRKRTVLFLADKLNIIDRVESGESATSIADQYNIGKSTVSYLMKFRDKLRAFASDELLHNGSDKRRTMRTCKNVELDKAVYNWFVQEVVQNRHVTGLMLRQKAVDLSAVMNPGQTFIASEGWLACFKNRHGIRLQRVAGEKRQWLKHEQQRRRSQLAKNRSSEAQPESMKFDEYSNSEPSFNEPEEVSDSELAVPSDLTSTGPSVGDLNKSPDPESTASSDDLELMGSASRVSTQPSDDDEEDDNIQASSSLAQIQALNM